MSWWHALRSTPSSSDFTAAVPGQKLVGDITYLSTEEGWLYLATVIDLHTREVVGHAMAEHMRTELARDAIDLATRRGLTSKNAIFHSDRGSQPVHLRRVPPPPTRAPATGLDGPYWILLR